MFQLFGFYTHIFTCYNDIYKAITMNRNSNAGFNTAQTAAHTYMYS